MLHDIKHFIIIIIIIQYEEMHEVCESFIFSEDALNAILKKKNVSLQIY